MFDRFRNELTNNNLPTQQEDRDAFIRALMKWEWSFLVDAAKEDEMQQYWLFIQAMLTHPKCYHGHLILNADTLKNKIQNICNLDRLPQSNAHSEMLLLRDAWDMVDICMYVAVRYKALAKFLFILLLLLGIAITSVAVLNSQIDKACELRGGCFSLNGKAASSGTFMSFSDALIFLLTLLTSIIGSLLAFWNPIERWQALRASAMHTESIIWRFRTRTGVFTTGNAGGKSSSIETSGEIESSAVGTADSLQTPAYMLRLKITQQRSSLEEGGDLLQTSFHREYSNSVYKHGQYQSPMSIRRESWIEFVMDILLALLCCGARNNDVKTFRILPEYRVDDDDLSTYAQLRSSVKSKHSHTPVSDLESGAAELDDKHPLLLTTRDDFQAPLGPEEYIELRLASKLQFYRARTPRYNQFYTYSQGLLIVGAAVGACMSFFGLARYVAIISAVSTSITAFTEFNHTSRKLARYNQVVGSLQNHLSWWKSLTHIETLDQGNISHLVLEAEKILNAEVGSWVSRPPSVSGGNAQGGSNSVDSNSAISKGSKNASGGASGHISRDAKIERLN